MSSVDFIQLQRREPTHTGPLGDIERTKSFFMSRCHLSESDAELAIELAGAALFLPDQKISVVGVASWPGATLACAHEVRGAEELDPEREYRLLRSPEALEHAAAASGHIELLDGHPPVNVDTVTSEELSRFRIGELGDVRFEPPFLRGSVIVTQPNAIEAIKSRTRRAWSIGYEVFDLDMTPGRFASEAYDGVIATLEVSHVGLVTESRGGLATRISLPKRS